MTVKLENHSKKLFSVPMLGILGLLLISTPDSSSSVVSGFYADGYAVDLFMLAIAIAFIAALLILKFKGKIKS